ncbi:DUF1648 domain-containing protein [Myroides sp. DF42-4-2]|uniref:DUF1648 domain-containing protein n=1 Tax=unclassified Myroides TaxID=2642485 RepID=UPI0025785E8E|nr:DUF1648 domain-containing protein [Myroides sp. DF42-4-2]MDM1406584.1 DUF1648 domain-containing protein [Myroides sp. DF42-4-2]
MAKNPILKITSTSLDRCIDGISLLLLVAFLGLTAYYYASLPETIPTHYNAAGEPDAYGHKASLFLLVGIALFIFILLRYFQTKPHLYNYPTTITEENAQEQYTKAVRMMRFLNLITLVIFFYLQYQTIQTALGSSEGLGSYFLVITLAVSLLPLLFLLPSKKKQITSK